MASTERVPPDRAALRAALAKQIRFIHSSANAVLRGDADEAVRIALALRVLLHDTGSSHSVLGQLGLKTRLQYVNSLRHLELAPGMVVALHSVTGELAGLQNGLVVTRLVDGRIRYVAPLGQDLVEARLPFDRWWRETVLHSDASPTFSRWDLVDAMAHADGGAHVDPRGVSKQYAQFKLVGAGLMSMPWAGTELPTENSFELTPAGDAATPTMLQIAWEFLETITRSRVLESDIL